MRSEKYNWLQSGWRSSLPIEIFSVIVFMPMCKVKILTEGITSVEP